MTDLVYLPATEALARFAARELSPVELLTAVIARAEAVEDEINAFAERWYDTALTAAREAEGRYLRGEARPLEGLPVALKEEQPIAGHPLRDGSLLLRDNVATVTHPIVDRIVAAGGIVHARTTTPEFCAAGFTHSDLWGITRNPWSRSHSAGGSSGGSGAALAAGTAALATGSDIGGSIRIPAAFNGVVGYKPPYGRVPGLPPYNLDHYCHDGPMARTVADCALLENVIAGQDPRDAVSLPAPPPIPPYRGNVAGRRVALCVHLGDYPVEDEVEAALRNAAEALTAVGAVVEEIELPWRREEIMRAAWAHYGAIFGPIIAEEVAAHGEGITRYARDFMERALGAEASFYEALKIEARVHADLAEVFARFDALLCPASGTPALAAGEDYVESPPVVAGVTLDHNLEVPLTVPFNLAGRCPVLSVPTGRSRAGVPTGAQVVGRPYDDHTVFEVGAAVTAALPWYADAAWRPEL
ncbi:aspartyl-tRNA(Asn)/glutamyl-tRNA(Gln) amidotransferase subunit A [Thermocatellispora tengchongensis]|uniref:Aspartyl-tRNA(Asn)/glutamyl-tRNA(Gln) amidotransferase subunit A n=1 Tax=Thermocatellispora tengchongensis TaxID=1073253 RepID=A0A840PG37_9ACTN|nr:amidase [Thermocatellispora tengchongensis]MBB5138538.1 aspartyl-tRNA(Asn)/glutamyl-tRNA(Gln) amidotransferase subunit A [Thermocatellispora tengchongensis]